MKPIGVSLAEVWDVFGGDSWFPLVPAAPFGLFLGAANMLLLRPM